MSNQRISSLPNLPCSDVTPSDLIPIVDRSSYVGGSQGELKNITAGDIVTYVENNITPGNTVQQLVYKATHSLSPGSVVRLDCDSGVYVTASANTTTGKESEVAGIVSYVVDVDNFNIVFAGIVDFGQTIAGGNSPSWISNNSLKIGVTYFLGDNGELYDNDPTITAYPNWISKPYLVGITPTQGLITNYRGFYQPSAETNSILNLFVTSSNNSFVIGDAVRKTKTSETSSLGDWTLASSDTYESSNAIGIVTQATPSYFYLQFLGRVSGLSDLEVGETYYLTSTGSINYFGTQCRNSSPVNENNCNRYSKPVFVAISTSEFVIINQQTAISSDCSSTPSYGPICYPGNTVPPSENIITLMNSILPFAPNNSSANVYWVQPVQNSLISTSNIVTWNLFKTQGGWFIGS
jgi:hypothetical protein